MRRLAALWRGELPLEEAFWTWAVTWGLVLNLVSTALFVALVMLGRPLTALLAGHALSLPFNLVATVGVWRSARHYPGPRHWAVLARLVTVAGMLLLSVV